MIKTAGVFTVNALDEGRNFRDSLKIGWNNDSFTKIVTVCTLWKSLV